MTVICDLQWHNMTLSTDRLTTTTTDKSDQEGGGRCPVVPLDVQLGLWGLFHFVEAGHEGRVPGDDEGREVQRLQLYSETFSDRLQEEEEEKEQKWAGTILHVVSFIWPVTISLQSTRPVTPAACSQLTDWLTRFTHRRMCELWAPPVNTLPGTSQSDSQWMIFYNSRPSHGECRPGVAWPGVRT